MRGRATKSKGRSWKKREELAKSGKGMMGQQNENKRGGVMEGKGDKHQTLLQVGFMAHH